MTGEKRYLSCGDLAAYLALPDVPECCSSCHADQDYTDENGGPSALGELYLGDAEANVCCTLSAWLRERGWSYYPERGTAHQP